MVRTPSCVDGSSWSYDHPVTGRLAFPGMESVSQGICTLCVGTALRQVAPTGVAELRKMVDALPRGTKGTRDRVRSFFWASLVPCGAPSSSPSTLRT